MLAHNNINCLGLHKQIRNQTICFAGNKKYMEPCFAGRVKG
jgi:hypothetical protein